MVPVIAGAAPRNGMLAMSTPAMALNSSSASKVAVPPEAWLSLPGLALACAISSPTVFTGTPSCTSTHLRDRGQQRHRLEVALRVVGEVRVDHRVHRHGAVVRHQQRVAVGRRLRRRLGADDHGGARAVLDHHRLAPELGELGRHHPRGGVDRAAGRGRHDDAHGAVGIALRGGRRRRGERRERGDQRAAANGVAGMAVAHGLPFRCPRRLRADLPIFRHPSPTVRSACRRPERKLSCPGRATAKPERRPGTQRNNRRAERVTILRFAILALGPGSRSAALCSLHSPGTRRLQRCEHRRIRRNPIHLSNSPSHLANASLVR